MCPFAIRETGISRVVTGGDVRGIGSVTPHCSVLTELSGAAGGRRRG